MTERFLADAENTVQGRLAVRDAASPTKAEACENMMSKIDAFERRFNIPAMGKRRDGIASRGGGCQRWDGPSTETST